MVAHLSTTILKFKYSFEFHIDWIVCLSLMDFDMILRSGIPS